MFTAQSLWAQWQPLLEAESEICFDCRDLNEFDSCGAQLFYFIVSHYAQKQQCIVRFSQVPDEILEDLASLNMQGIVTDTVPGEA